jgi:hypothetical protein
MGQIKISQLTPKDAPLSTTDLLIIAKETPDGYESKSVTGRDIQQSVGKFGDQFGINTDTPEHSLQVESEEQCIILAKTSNTTGGGVALMDANTSDEFQVGVGAFADRLCLRSNAELFKFPTLDGTSGQAMVTDGSGNLSFASASANPTLLAFSGKTGTPTTTNTITVCHSVLIPANTFTNNNILQVVFRMFRQSGNFGQMYGRIYFNTANTLTGATLFNTNFTMNNIHQTGYVERNFSYDGTNLTSYLNAAYSDNTVGNIVNVAFDATVDNYVLLTMQCQNFADVANINLFKIFSYA